MSEDEGTPGRSAVGPFLVGLALGAALGALFAPESGTKIRARVGKRAGRLREDLGDIVDELRTVMATEEETDASPREHLRRRLHEARAARRTLPGAGAGTADTPLA